jgi:hypothetical protein
MEKKNQENDSQSQLPTPVDQASGKIRSRRAFLKLAGAATAASIASTAIGLEPILGSKAAIANAQEAAAASPGAIRAAAIRRRNTSYIKRVNAARDQFRVPLPTHVSNGDETLYPTFIGNFSKGLAHDASGEVSPAGYGKFLTAVNSGKPSDFAAITMGGTVLLVNPQSALAFDLEGADSHQLLIPPSPAVASAQRAGEAIENYWQALLRDVPFSQYGTDAGALQAIADLNAASDFRGPKQSGLVTAQTLFRGFTAGDVIGPYVSQFFLPTLAFGAGQISQQYQTYLPLNNGGSDYLTDFASYLQCQNGTGPFGVQHFDSTRRYLRNGRDLSAWVHVDVLFQAYFQACLYLIDNHAPLNPGNPYRAPNPDSINQAGFGTFGAPHLKTILSEVSTRALKAVWYQKWNVHRALRPEAYGGLVHQTLGSANKNYPLHHDILNSSAVAATFSRNGTYLLPMAFAEGCPQHPSYASGHATVAGACVTIIKAFFDGTIPFANLGTPMMPSDDGLLLNPYTGSDAGQMTVAGEANKIAANVAVGRNHSGVHWRSDYEEALRLGEAIAISILKDQRPGYNETFNGLTFTTFDGQTITV